MSLAVFVGSKLKERNIIGARSPTNRFGKTVSAGKSPPRPCVWIPSAHLLWRWSTWPLEKITSKWGRHWHPNSPIIMVQWKITRKDERKLILKIHPIFHWTPDYGRVLVNILDMSLDVQKKILHTTQFQGHEFSRLWKFIASYRLKMTPVPRLTAFRHNLGPVGPDSWSFRNAEYTRVKLRIFGTSEVMFSSSDLDRIPVKSWWNPWQFTLQNPDLIGCELSLRNIFFLGD